MNMDIPDLSEVSLVCGDLTELNVAQLGSDIQRLDLSYNSLHKLKGLEIVAESLEELILDNNQLTSLDFLNPTTFKNLHTLTLNKNKISDIKALLQVLKRRTPALTYLSLLGNPMTPDNLTPASCPDETDHQIYRYHVLHHLPTLRFLDHREVTLKERQEARKGLYGKLDLPLHDWFNTVSKSKQGKRKFKYVGKNSEGNRFIKDGDL